MAQFREQRYNTSGSIPIYLPCADPTYQQEQTQPDEIAVLARMPTIRLETYINAPIERCFDLSLNVDLHAHTMAHTHEHPVAGVTQGLMHLGDTVTWEAVHFGLKQHLTSKITAYERPLRFTDEMVKGAFQELHHTHEFVAQPPGTLMIDVFMFRAPLGILGRVAEALVLTRYMKNLLLARNRYLKQVAEAEIDLAPPS
ncbi:MAG TPA: SRPBCC family protein [Ktedonobacterales bacterium]